MINRLDIITFPTIGSSTVKYFELRLQEAIQRSGLVSNLVPIDAFFLDSFINLYSQNPPDCTICFNGLRPTSDGFLCDKLRIPHIAILLDSSFYYISFAQSSYNICACVDQLSSQFCRDHSFKNVIFLPHAVEKDLSFHQDTIRTYDVVFLSSTKGYDRIEKLWKEKYPKFLHNALLAAAEIYLADPNIALLDCLATAMSSERGQGQDIHELYNELEMYARDLDRIRLVQSIKDARVDIFGKGNTQKQWDKYLGPNQRNVFVHEEVSFTEALEIMKKSKIVLNSCAWIKAGGHERIFSALACGALVMTNENHFLTKYFTDGQNILFCRLNDKTMVNDKINEVLGNEDKRREMARQGCEIVMKYHTWDNRVEQLKKELDPILKKDFSKK